MNDGLYAVRSESQRQNRYITEELMRVSLDLDLILPTMPYSTVD